MSSGKVHTLYALVMTAEYTLGALVTLNPSNLEYALGALIGVVLNPDLDVDHGHTDSYKIIKRRFGIVPHFGWRVMWYPYRKSMRHGSLLSHFPVVGTVGRITYLFLFVIVIPYFALAPILHLNFWSEIAWWLRQVGEHYKIVLGLMSIDFIHWVLDISTKHRKERRNGYVRTKPIDYRVGSDVERDV